MFIHMLCHICQNLVLFLWGVVGEPKFNDLFVFGRPGLVLDSWKSNTTLVAVVSCWYTSGSFGSVTGWTMLFTGFSSNMWAGNWYGSLLIRSLYRVCTKKTPPNFTFNFSGICYPVIIKNLGRATHITGMSQHDFYVDR